MSAPEVKSQSGYVGFDEKAPADNRGRQDVEYVRIEQGQSALLRPIGKPWAYHKHWRPISAISPGKDRDACWLAGNEPQRRFAMRCVDRRTGRPAIWCFPEVVYWKLCSWAMDHKADPGGRDAPDWLVTCGGTSDRTEWKCDPQVVRPYTAEEKVVLKQWFDATDLAKLFAPDTPERIAMLYREAMEKPGGPVPGSTAWQEARA